jgi:hypothetical protein
MITSNNKKIVNHEYFEMLSDCLQSTIESTPETESFRLFSESLLIRENITFLTQVYEFKNALKDFKKNWQVVGINLNNYINNYRKKCLIIT